MSIFTVVALLIIVGILIGIGVGVGFGYLTITPSGACDVLVWALILAIFFIVIGVYM